MDPKCAFIIWGALCFLVGAVFMAFVRVERGDLDEPEENTDMMEEEGW